VALDDDIRDLEARVLKKAAGTFLEQVAAIRLLLAQGSPDVAKAVLKLVAPKVERPLLAAVVEAYVTGAATAADIAEVDDPEVGRISKTHAAAIKGLDAELTGALAQTKRLLKVEDVDDLTALAPLLRAANRVTQTTTSEVVSAANLAVRAVANGAGLLSVWVAERDGCVRCLAYAGKTVESGKDFPGGLTFGRPAAKKPPSISGPSLHPHCRCFLEPLNDPSYAEALEREARRSILRGYSLESETQGVRLDAAKRLLEKGSGAPKSVDAFARKSIRAGAFADRGAAARAKG
jgi:hypothetical protein